MTKRTRTPRRPARSLHLEELGKRIAPAAGAIDPSFGGTGILGTGIPSVPSIVEQSSGKIIVTLSDPFLERINSDGTLDTSFGSNGRVPYGGGSGLVVQPDDKILLPHGPFGVDRYSADGTPDTSFGDNGTASASFNLELRVSCLAIQPDGKIVVAGEAGNSNHPDFAVARYNADGILDTTFGDHGLVTTQFGPDWSRGMSVVVQPDGRCYRHWRILIGHRKLCARSGPIRRGRRP